MQQQLADMTAQLRAVETEHDQLTGRNSLLEKVLHVRQLQLEILQDQQQVGTFNLYPRVFLAPQSYLGQDASVAQMLQPNLHGELCCRRSSSCNPSIHNGRASLLYPVASRRCHTSQMQHQGLP